MSTLCHSLCKHARSISWQQQQQQNNRREVTCWHFDNNSSSTCVAQLSFFFLLLLSFHSKPTELFMRCSSNFWTTTDVASPNARFFFVHFSLLLLPLLVGMHFRFNGFQRDALVHLSKIYIKSTYIINFSTVFFCTLLFFIRLKFECRMTKEHSGQKCNCIFLKGIFHCITGSRVEADD